MNKLILAIAGFVGIYFLLHTRSKFAKTITVGLIASVVLTVLPFNEMKTATFVLFGLVTLSSCFYAFTNKKGLKSILGIISISLPAFISFLFKIMNWSRIEIIQLLMVIAVMTYVYILFRREEFKNEIAFLTILAGYAFASFLA